MVNFIFSCSHAIFLFFITIIKFDQFMQCNIAFYNKNNYYSCYLKQNKTKSINDFYEYINNNNKIIFKK